MIKDLGLRVVRIGVSWCLMEPQPGLFPESFWQGVDRALNEAEVNGLKVIVVMADSPC